MFTIEDYKSAYNSKTGEITLHLKQQNNMAINIDALEKAFNTTAPSTIKEGDSVTVTDANGLTLYFTVDKIEGDYFYNHKGVKHKLSDATLIFDEEIKAEELKPKRKEKNKYSMFEEVEEKKYTETDLIKILNAFTEGFINIVKACK